jgi:hypothetical protein
MNMHMHIRVFPLVKRSNFRAIESLVQIQEVAVFD